MGLATRDDADAPVAESLDTRSPCPRCGCALIDVETFISYDAARSRYVFSCGWSFWSGPSVPPITHYVSEKERERRRQYAAKKKRQRRANRKNTHCAWCKVKLPPGLHPRIKYHVACRRLAENRWKSEYRRKNGRGTAG